MSLSGAKWVTKKNYFDIVNQCFRERNDFVYNPSNIFARSWLVQTHHVIEYAKANFSTWIPQMYLSNPKKNYLTIRFVLQIGKHEFSAPWKLSSPKFHQRRNKATHSSNKHHSRAFKQFCHIRWWKGINMGKFLTSSKHKPHGTNLRAFK